MNKKNTGGNRDVLDARLSGLVATAIEVQTGPYRYTGNLVDEFYKDETTREYIIRINPKLKTLFEPDQFTLIDFKTRQALEGKSLAQWLHGYYSSHAEPYPVKIETLHKLCGSETSELWKFTQNLKKALEELALALRNDGKIFDFRIENDLIIAKKTPSKTQQKHLKKLPKKGKKQTMLKK
jgi:hypothetical protein